MSVFELEVCVDTIQASIAAEQAGATRLELNAALSEDGLTPSIGVLRCVKQVCGLPVLCMARPHNRGFAYSKHDQQSIIHDCELLIENGADGIVVGALSPQHPNELDWDFLAEIATRFPSTAKVMHRAFDHVTSADRSPDPAEKISAAKRLGEMGFCRILTSGGHRNAVESPNTLSALHEQAGSAIEILPGGGVREQCARQIIRSTGIMQLHGSFRGTDGLPSAAEIQAVKRQLAEFADELRCS